MAAMLIITVKRISPSLKIMVPAEDETDKTRVFEYGADDFTTKPIGVQTIVDRVYNVLLRKPQVCS
ncbi:MAG: hypothetical protein WAZ77_20050 [Candidatus Nitrosopolaris sp.]